ATLTAISVNADAGVCTYASSQLTAPTASDNCTTVTVTRSPASLVKGLNTVTWTTTDAAGLTATSTQSVTVIDNQIPTITCPANKTANTNADGTGNCTTTVSLGTPTATDNCTTAGNFTFIAKVGGSVINPATYLFGTGTTTVVWTATDQAGNVSVPCNQTVTVTDNEAPLITCPGNITTAKTSNDGTGNCTTTVVLGSPTVSDNCTAVGSLVVTNNAPLNFPIGLTVVTWTVKDAVNNTTTCTQNVSVTDDENPSITAPANINTTTDIACTATSVALGTPITADNCSVASVTNNHASTTYPLGTTTVIWTVTDGSGRTATANQTVTVKDTTNPTLTQGANQSAFTAAGTCTASVAILDAGFADNCSGSTIAYTLSGATVKALTAGQVGTYTFNKGITTITYTVSDAATPPNTFTGSKTVTVTDNVKPVAPALSTITAQCNITVPFPVATDNCDGPITATTSDNRTFSTQGNGAIIWSFKDSSNNETIVTQNVVIDDTIAPVPTTASLSAVNITNCQIDSLTPPTANDNCKGVINGTTTTPFPITTIGTTVITWTYNDGNGNSSTQTQNVNLTKPAISGGSLLGYVSGLTPAATPSENIAITSCPDDINPITINLSGEIGTIVRWEKFEAGDTAWSVIANTTNSYSMLFDYSNTKSTLFRVLVQVGNCTVYSNMVNVHAIPPDVPPILDQSLFTICLNDSVSLIARNGYTSTVAVGDGGDFNEGQFPNKFDPTQWKIDNVVAGTAWTAAANNTKVNNWTGTNDAKNVGTLYIIKYDNGTQGKKFGMAHGNYNSADYISRFGVGPTTLETPIFSLVGLQTASVDFDQAFNLHAGDYAKLELSLDGGATYTITLQELIGKNPPLTWDWQNHSPSTASSYKFANDNSTFDISDYIGNDNVRVKWTFFGTTDESVWAIDNIAIPVKPYSDEIEWTDGLGNPGEYIVQGNLEVAYTFVPSAPGVHQYGATNLINGCRAYDPDGTALATVKVNYAYAGQAQGYTNAECGERTVSLNAYDNTKSADLNKANGAYPLALNTFSDDPGTMATGTWSVVTASNACGTYSFSNVSSPTSTFSGDEGVYTLRWKLDVSGCYSDVQVTLTSCKVIDFDGVNDYISFKDNYGLGNAFSIEVWVKPDPQPASPPSNIQTIISKRNANSLVNGYDLRLVGSTLSFNWNNGSQITSPFPLTTSRWYHVAVTYTTGIYRLYVDGIEVINAAGSAPISNGFTCLAGAMDQTGNPPNKPVNHFSGWMDELRIWNVGLSSDHVRQMMNQQITNNGTAVRGEIIPIDINGPDANTDGIDDQPLLWSNLNGYYRMDFITCGYLKPFGGKGVDGQLRNITSSQEQTAPLPYVSIRDGNWTDRGAGTTPWIYGDSVWDYPNSTGYNGTQIDWNIVQTSHNINSGDKDITILGLVSTAGKLTIADPIVTSPIEKNDGQALWITHYLKLNGNIDLIGESQLLEKRYGIYNSSDVFTTTQYSESILDVSSSGFIKRDQQGKKNSYNYNYWTSPVSTIQAGSNNMPYTIKNVLKDGTNSALPKTINFGTTFDFADSALSSPIKLTDRWIWSYNSLIVNGADWDNYYQWNHITSSGTLQVGEAYTMKGSGGVYPITDIQNYSFIGKPNSGTISLNLAKDNSYLVGNPYPSALDADEFIKDNLKDCLGCRATVNKFSGALYFWDHFGLSNNHNLAEYQGGYATYTMMGGVVGINDSPLNLNNNANGSNKPKRFIPIGQGFFIDGYLDTELSGPQFPTVVDGGTIIFKNNQRAFKKENPTSSVFMKTRAPKKAIVTKPKIRLGFDSSVGAHRQLLVGADPNTTDQFDIGYDALMYDTNENDLYWKISESQFVIQGVPDFNTDRNIPLGIAVANEGQVTIKIDELEDVPSNTKIYLHDSETGIYHDLKNSNFKTTLAVGNYDNRFSLTFESLKTETSLDVAENDSNDGIIVLYSNNYKILIIKNNIPDSTVNTVSLYNMLGQLITNWDVKDKEQTNIQIPIKNMSSGIYIVKIKTSKGESSKKIIVN
ncbi:MAG: HYR domain-containing protein, partial [Flavobacterium sp.]|nr:HYR domain-containing protein [Flavobacterium sp.]